MLEEVKRYGGYQLVGDQRDVALVNPILELSRSQSGRKRNGSRNLKKAPRSNTRDGALQPCAI